MNKIEIIVEYFEYQFDELRIDEQELINQSIIARENAYAPNSKFRVGAALKLDNGEFILGNNQENKASPSGLCAERVALFHYGSLNIKNEIKAIAVCANNETNDYIEIIKPCGGCLQVLVEYESKQSNSIVIYLYSNDGKVWKTTGVKNLLPLMFKF
ncbi:MAG: cytidine deaminase [bacterium]|jgi:cytidine deaminase